MVLLDRIMTRLRAEGGHQTLIFSQMTTQLDILQARATHARTRERSGSRRRAGRCAGGVCAACTLCAHRHALPPPPPPRPYGSGLLHAARLLL